jgi:hypothetical protein
LKPTGSSIVHETKDGATIYSWSQPNGGLFRYLIAAFLIAWLCGWLMGMVFAISTLLGQNNAKGPPTAFLLVWLTIWTIGGLLAMFMAYKILRPGTPESLAVSDDSLFYDSGTLSPIVMMMPFQFGARSNPFEAFNRLFRKRRLQQFKREDFSGFVFENSGTTHRLYFDDGADRIIVGECLREPDREWLSSELAAWMKT